MTVPIENHLFVDVSMPIKLALSPGQPGYEDFLAGNLESEVLYDLIVEALKSQVRAFDSSGIIENTTSITLDLQSETERKIRADLRRAIAANPEDEEQHRNVTIRVTGGVKTVQVPDRWLRSFWAGDSEIERVRSWFNYPGLVIVRIH